MNKHSTLGLALILAMFLISCGPAQPTTAPLTAPTLAATATQPKPTATNTIAPTNTATVTPTLEPTATSTVTPTPVAYGPDNFPANVDPLTGLTVSDPKLLDRRPIGIKINIYPRSNTRPPWGLSAADIVYEYYHNGGAARYFAVFYGEDPELAGPIRSGRLLDNYLIEMYNSYFVYGGADPVIDKTFLNANYSKRILRGGYDNLACPPTAANPLCTFEPNGKHNLIGSLKDMRAYLDKAVGQDTRQNLNGMSFNEVVPQGGKAGTQVTVRYSLDMYGQFKYDATTGRYMVSEDTAMDQGAGEKFAPLIDRNTEKQIGVDNVVVLLVPDRYVQPRPNEIVQIDLLGSGKAYAYRDGQMYEVTWNHPNPNTVLYLTYPDGKAYPLKPGKTWFEVVNPESTVTDQGSGAWHFKYFIRP